MTGAAGEASPKGEVPLTAAFTALAGHGGSARVAFGPSTRSKQAELAVRTAGLTSGPSREGHEGWRR